MRTSFCRTLTSFHGCSQDLSTGVRSVLPPLSFLPSTHSLSISHFHRCVLGLLLSDGWYQKILPWLQLHFTYAYRTRALFFSITYVRHAYFIPKGEIWSLLAYMQIAERFRQTKVWPSYLKVFTSQITKYISPLVQCYSKSIFLSRFSTF